MFWYVLFVKTGHEEKAVEEINKLWQIENSMAFIPRVWSSINKWKYF